MQRKQKIESRDPAAAYEVLGLSRTASEKLSRRVGVLARRVARGEIPLRQATRLVRAATTQAFGRRVRRHSAHRERGRAATHAT